MIGSICKHTDISYKYLAGSSASIFNKKSYLNSKTSNHLADEYNCIILGHWEKHLTKCLYLCCRKKNIFNFSWNTFEREYLKQPEFRTQSYKEKMEFTLDN